MKQLPLIDISDCFSKRDVAIKLNLSLNGKTSKIVGEYITNNNLDFSHFDSKKNSRKYKEIDKVCPVCTKLFKVKEGSPKEKVTCSYACANTYFRSGLNNPNFKEGSNHRTMCFIYHIKECIFCKENKIVEVHHYDENHLNNDPTNLVPMCPTHHQYIHSRYKDEIQPTVDSYISKFKETWLAM